MSADEIYQRLQGLKLFGMAALCDELLAHRERPLPPPEQWLKRMIEAEESERQCVWRWYSPDSCPQKGVVIRLQTG